MSSSGFSLLGSVEIKLKISQRVNKLEEINVQQTLEAESYLGNHNKNSNSCGYFFSNPVETRWHEHSFSVTTLIISRE